MAPRETNKDHEDHEAVNDAASRPQASSKNGRAKFPLNCMPAELLCKICIYLTPTQVASIRIIGRKIAGVGLEYIARTVTLTHEEASFHRLLEIAHHPVISKFVNTLRYEHDFLRHFDREEWELHVTPVRRRSSLLPTYSCFDPALFDRMEWLIRHTRSRIQSLSLSDRKALDEQKASDRKAWRAKTYSETQLDEAFLIYQRHRAEGDRARRLNFFSNILTHVLQHLPELKSINMPAHGTWYRYQSEIAGQLDGANFDKINIYPDNVAVTRSILVAVDRAVRGDQDNDPQAARVDCGDIPMASHQISSNVNVNDQSGSDQVRDSLGGRVLNGGCLKKVKSGSTNQRVLQIKNFEIESFNWRLLLESDEVFESIKRSLSHLTKLNMSILDDKLIQQTGPLRDDEEDRRERSRKDRLHQLVSAAPGLVELSVLMSPLNRGRNPYPMDVVGSFHWASLKTVHFGQINISFGSLENFCSRHSSTLVDLSLGSLRMYEPSPWAGIPEWRVMFTEIRQATNLKKAKVYGIFETNMQWDMYDYEDVRCASGTLIGRYLVGEGGDRSLYDFMNEERSKIAQQNRSRARGLGVLGGGTCA